MVKHKYAAGDRVIAMPDKANENLRTGVYVILRALPEAGRGCQYRAKSVLETHERVLDEALLRRAE
jgi:hypothetical protein